MELKHTSSEVGRVCPSPIVSKPPGKTHHHPPPQTTSLPGHSDRFEAHHHSSTEDVCPGEWKIGSNIDRSGTHLCVLTAKESGGTLFVSPRQTSFLRDFRTWRATRANYFPLFMLSVAPPFLGVVLNLSRGGILQMQKLISPSPSSLRRPRPVKVSLFKAWSRSEYTSPRLACCQE